MRYLFPKKVLSAVAMRVTLSHCCFGSKLLYTAVGTEIDVLSVRIGDAVNNPHHSNSLAVKQTTVKGFKSLQAFMTKFNNDWVLSFASGLAFNLMTAIIPIIIAIIALAGFLYGGLNPAIQEELIQHIQSIFPPPIPSQEIIGLALNTLNQDAGVLAIIAIVMAIIGGLGLFVAMEGKFDIIYQTRTRGILPQYIMALGMLLVFVVLSPLMIFADTFPTIVDAFVQTTPLGQSATNGFGLALLTIFCGLLAT